MFSDELAAASHFLKLARRKRSKGYKPIGSCGNAAEVSSVGIVADDRGAAWWKGFRSFNREFTMTTTNEIADKIAGDGLTKVQGKAIVEAVFGHHCGIHLRQGNLDPRFRQI